MRFAALIVLFGVYGVLLLWLTMSPHPVIPGVLRPPPRLHPFRTTVECLQAGGRTMLVNVVGNIAAFVPLGVLWPLLRGGRTGVWNVGALAAGVSVLIEGLQYASGRRIADVDDVILNTAGGLLGYGLVLLFGRLLPLVGDARPRRSGET